MPCNLPIQKGFRQPADCKCYGAVMRTYRALCDEPHTVALEAAQRVYAFHHPEDSKDDVALTVQRWIAEEHVH